MNSLKNLKIIVVVITVLLISVIVRNADRNVFKEKPKTAFEATHDNSNLITLSKLREIKTPYLVIDLGNEPKHDSLHFEHSVHIPFKKLLDKSSREILDQAKGGVILFTNDMGTASKAWIILNQLGYKNVFILTSDENPGELKYKFQPDTTARLEQELI